MSTTNSPTPDMHASTSTTVAEPQRATAADSGRDTGRERVLVAIATYNEMESLPDVVRAVQRVLPDADLLIVDDNSPDGTGGWIAKRAASSPRIVGIHRPFKMGLGSATMEALRYAVEHDYTYVVSLDADGSHDPKYVPSMLNALRPGSQTAPDIVIGSRYIEGGCTRGWPLHRRVMSRAVNSLARVLLSLPVRDCSSAFRCTRVELLKQVDLGSFRSRGYSLFEELLWRFKQASARFEEIPIVFSNRTRGQSKINARETVSALWMLLRLGIRNWLRVG